MLFLIDVVFDVDVVIDAVVIRSCCVDSVAKRLEGSSKQFTAAGSRHASRTILIRAYHRGYVMTGTHFIDDLFPAKLGWRSVLIGR